MYWELYETTEITFPVDTGRKLKVHKTFRRRPGRLLNILMCVQFTSCVYGVQRWAFLKENHENTKRINFQFHFCKFSKQRNFTLFIISSALEVLILIIYRINFSFKMQFLGFSWRKSSKFFPVRPLVFLFLMNIKVP